MNTKLNVVRFENEDVITTSVCPIAESEHYTLSFSQGTNQFGGPNNDVEITSNNYTFTGTKGTKINSIIVDGKEYPIYYGNRTGNYYFVKNIGAAYNGANPALSTFDGVSGKTYFVINNGVFELCDHISHQ